MISEQDAAKLLDFNEKQFDINLLDTVVQCMHTGSGIPQKSAQELLTNLKAHPEAWTRVDAILEYSQNLQTKYFALQILENLINTRWRILPRDQCEGIKKYIVGLVIKTSSDSAALEREKVYLNKLNLVLVQIVKREWPKNWPSFITDIVGASQTNESLCQNNMVILKLLSEEVFDYSAGQMTQSKAHHLKQQFCGEFQAVFQLCLFVLEGSQNAPLVEATLETLLKFMNWIPLGYIFETKLINTLATKFLNVPMFRNVTLQCLTEAAGVNIPTNAKSKYDQEFIALFTDTMKQLTQIIPLDTSICEAYKTGSDTSQKFIANLAMFLSTFLKDKSFLIEAEPSETRFSEDLLTAHRMGLEYLMAISKVDDVEIFKICLEYWYHLAYELYRESPYLMTYFGGGSSGYPPSGKDQLPFRRKLYDSHLSQLRSIMIDRMAKPEEVLVVENEQGEVVRETIKDTDSINLYKTMRETLVYLTHLDYADTELIMTGKLQNQVNGSDWSWKSLNRLCWAIGSISGAMQEEDEKRFLVTVVRDLLGLCEQKRGKDNKAVIASNIMYVVGQYPRFLRAHWKFLKTVVNKLFEFMHETHEGVQDMACDTFIKIAFKCRKHFVMMQAGESNTFIREILMNLNTIINDLQPSQVHVFYEALGVIISSEVEDKVREDLIERLMALPNTAWNEIIHHAAQDVEILKNPEVVKNLANMLKTNVSACKSIGDPFILQLSKIYMDMLNVYKVMSENLSAAVQANGESVLKQPLIKSIRGVKTEVLKLISTWVGKSEDADVVMVNLVPPLFEAVLFDYQRNVPAAREPEVLHTLTVITTRLKETITPEVPRIFDAVFECTLDMINKNFEEFPEHREGFFLLLQSVNEHCFTAFFKIPAPQFKLILDAIIWAFKHSMRNVAEIGLEILHKLLKNISEKTPSEAAQSFYQTFFVLLLEHILSVVTDSSQAQVAGLFYYATILAYMFQLVETKKITVSLNPAQPVMASEDANMDFLFGYVSDLLKKAFPHLSSEQIRVTVKGFFSFDNDTTKFKEHLRDFLVQIKELHGEDTTDLFLDEREREIQEQQTNKLKQAINVPGLLNPYDQNLADEMQA